MEEVVGVAVGGMMMTMKDKKKAMRKTTILIDPMPAAPPEMVKPTKLRKSSKEGPKAEQLTVTKEKIEKTTVRWVKSSPHIGVLCTVTALLQNFFRKGWLPLYYLYDEEEERKKERERLARMKDEELFELRES